MHKVIAIDGPSGAGKSTIAKLVSEMMGFSYLDTGALYRATALGLRSAGVSADDPEETVIEALKNIRVVFSEGNIYLNGVEVSKEIRTPEAGHYSSVFSALRPVREYLMPVQKEAGMHNDLVAEGRDMTTVVFPNAMRKFYLDATVEERARRRYIQLQKNGVNINMDEAIKEIKSRDERDSSRDIAPLRVAPDAIYIDSSKMTLEEVVKAILDATRDYR